MRKTYALLGAAAFLVGALAPLTVSASDYEEVGRVADGVHLVTSDEDRFKIHADEATGLLVYKPSGELVLAGTLDAGEERVFALDGSRAVVALSGGEATVEATGAGNVTELDTTRERIELAHADGESVDRSITVELPRLLVGIAGHLDGDATDLLVTGRTDEGTAFQVRDGEVDHLDRQVVPAALDAGFLDVHVNATRLNGTLMLELVTPVLPGSPAPASLEAASVNTSEPNPAPSIGELSHTPIRFDVQDEATLTFDVEHGYVLDASVYDADGSQVWHVHRGPDVAEARNHCRDIFDCQTPWWHDQEETVGPQTIEHTLGEGTYLLYVRSGAVEGNLTLEDPEDETLFDDAEELEFTSMEVSGDREVSFDAPLIDIYLDNWSSGIERNVTVTVDGEMAYTYEATASGWEYSMDAHRAMWPDRLEAGQVEVTDEGLKDPQHGGNVHLLTVDFGPE